VIAPVAERRAVWDTGDRPFGRFHAPMRSADTKISISRWRMAKRAVLGSIVLAGAVATSAAVMVRMGSQECPSYHRGDRAYTYSGIGVVIEREDGDVVVRQVLPNGPASGVLRPGARLVSVDGETPETLEAWTSAIRGAPGTMVELEIAYPCGGRNVIELERAIIRMHR
jgi:C-terminal processing protease CtpA/Prc